MKRRGDNLRTLAEGEERRAMTALRDGDAAGARDALQRAQRLRRIAYLRAAAAAYKGDPALNPEQDQLRDQELAVQFASWLPQGPLMPQPGLIPRRRELDAVLP